MRRLLVLTMIVFLLLSFIGLEPVYAQGGVYTVRPGDTLTGIAARYGVSVSQLAAANGLGRNAWVYVGQKLALPGQASPAAPSTASGAYVVRRGDTLTGIAAWHGVSLSQLAVANGLSVTSWVYVGQRLAIPGSAAAGTTTTPPPTAPGTTTTSGGTYVVRPGDTLIGIARWYGVSTSQLAARNGLYWNSWVYVGQRLAIPGQTSSNPADNTNPVASTNPPAATVSGKWIDVNLSTQTLTAYEGQTAVLSARVSTGVSWAPTVVGTFKIYVKYVSAGMSGPGYNLPNVPYVMYFYRGYGLHGTYWHNNFGTPMSHGCVNMATADAKWLFNWAPVGTKVVTHY
ncbi:MAG: LysM peptidoglycan-binding domain-containing protein [Anaerolineae bacterium]|nr:LysM peptidoglycan-binding domain-containing protein [Anaerolineae bacterium]